MIGHDIAAARIAGAIEQRKLTAEALQHHFGRIAVLAGLILPFARLQLPLDENLDPFLRYCSATLQRFSLKVTTQCHSVFSLRSPVALSRQLSEVAMRRLAIGRPSCV